MTDRTVKTSDGRTITYRERGPGDVLALLELGPATPSTAWMEYALMVTSVEAIDTVPVIRPQTRVQLEQLANQIGHTGIEALSTALFGADGQAAAQAEGTAAKN
ncbi:MULTISPECIES: hypothetical protein [Komagataeibacter]|uniref:Uncharacterized protein n=1 Tax=Komagataeibacter saccharivorans TaxID=265959 RepID=A0A347WEX9_9PROT|nr:hypothetical protein [Komagataeibacter saccharivorans]MBL7237727.1 hypothetical protein [Novacetimonas hansenii]AXY23422.1 hypothetical protein CD178_02675 [Komagataeibacter saccharivorans]PYD50285.1 hypothetical protein CFR79_10095 [Komagataeibacter saccharivorans]QBL92680.1 hypothetical protein KSAC_04340 [Komagataeibacter saccharivorans]GBQ39904.1 hypothetical protein AA0614_1817 [Komagataeibacter saccharivorans NRIC 0614]